MGIRVSRSRLDRQLTEAGCEARRTLDFHRALLAGELPLTIGGGIGQSRLCMALLGEKRTSARCRRLCGTRRHAPPVCVRALICCKTEKRPE